MVPLHQAGPDRVGSRTVRPLRKHPIRDVDRNCRRRGSAHGEETEGLSDFVGLLRAGHCAPSMKAALEAWGADSNLFHQGVAKESHDPAVIAATIAKPGVVLKRSVGSDGPFGEHAELPKNLGEDGRKKPAQKPSAKAKMSSAQPDKGADRKPKRTNGSASAASAPKPGKRRPDRRSAHGGGRPSTRHKRR
jgi:hypothetical protein